jgi:hemerythrin-like domain-containing protein
MSTTKTERQFESIHREHKELRKIISEIQEFLRLPRPAVGDEGYQEWSAGMSKRVVRLHGRISRHFHREDEEQMLEKLARRHPRASSVTDRLQEEHGEILAELRQLAMASLKYEDGKSPQDPQLRKRLVAVLDHLTKHEQEETGLMVSMEYDDLGMCD